MFRRSICKALALQQFNKSAAASCQALSLQQRRLISTAFTPAYNRSSLLACQKTKLNFYNSFRTMATIPDSVVTKSASTENGIDISKKAVKQLKHIYKRDSDDSQMLRILVDSGGCHGYQNKMELTNTVDEEDTIFEKEGVKVVVDSISLQFLRGSMVDYVQELIGSTFQVVDNPNAKHSCGCNISYDIDLDKVYKD